MFQGHLDYFQKPPLVGRPNTKSGDHSTPKSHNRRFIIFYHVWGPRMNRNSLKQHFIDARVTYDFTLHLSARNHNIWFWKRLGTAILLDSHNFMVTVLNSCVKWPWVSPLLNDTYSMFFTAGHDWKCPGFGSFVSSRHGCVNCITPPSLTTLSLSCAIILSQSLACVNASKLKS